MTVSLMLSALVVGGLVGVVVGALGAGGGILAVPVLVYLLGQSPHQAATGSLVVVLVTAAVSLPSRHRHRQVLWRQGLLFGAVSAVGAWAGSWLNRQVSGQALMALLGVLLCVVCLVMARDALLTRRQEDVRAAAGLSGTLAEADAVAPLTGQPADGRQPRARPVVVALAAVVTGCLTGFFGVGGGFAVVPVLRLLLRFDMRRAAGTSLCVMVVTTLASLAQRATTGLELDLATVLVFTIASALGGAAGGPLSQRVRPSTLAALFALLLMVVAARTLVGAVTG